ncbi:MAG: NADP-dependent oxidoreductase [Actinomycetota bacterium]|nr:NADP-dependent oxidoreductase [Actinomycetota bacterium]
MRALTLAEVPGTPAITDVEAPAPAAGELLVRVRASSVNGFDLGTIAGYLQGMMEHRFPLIPGRDFAGTVEAVGDGVEGFQVGDEVFGMVAKAHLGNGSFAQYVTVPAAMGVAHRPDALAVQDAGALGLAGAAAVAGLDALGELAGRTVLISGATGGVGAFALQLATARGARVIATARPGAEADFVRTLAPSAEIVDYATDVTGQVRALAPEGVDAVLHLAGDLSELTALARDGGAVASALATPDDTEDRGLRVSMVMTTPTPELLAELAELAAAGTLIVPVTAVYDLEQAPDAFTAFATGKTGKISLAIN